MNRKNLTAAVLAGLAGAVGIVGSAQAVNVNPDGLGQVLIYPYYTTNGGNITLLSVVNTTEHAKAVKVRFLEGENSREVLDFNLYMSKYDVWTAAVLPGADEDGTPYMLTTDTTCTVPYFYGDQDGMQDFLPWALNDVKPKTFDDIGRAREGHLEMIEMGEVYDEKIINKDYDPEDDDSEPLVVGWGSASAITHKDGVPADCDQLVDAWTRGGDGKNGYWIGALGQNFRDMKAPSGGLFGGAGIVNGEDGTMYSYDAKAINGFADDLTSDLGDDMHQEPGTILPSLDSGGVLEATVFLADGSAQDALNIINMSRGVDAVSYVFMHDQIMNEYTTESGVAGATEWVLTFPTKQFYVHQDFLDEYADFRNDDAPTAPIAPFTTTWTWVPKVENEDGTLKTAGYVDRPCEVVRLDSIWDREEQTDDPEDGPDQGPIVSPAPPVVPGAIPFFSLCYETQVIRFGEPLEEGEETEILGSVNVTNIDNGELGFEHGWARLTLVNATSDIDGDGDMDPLFRRSLGGLFGLPVTGFAAFRYGNFMLGDGNTTIANYGGIYQNKGTRSFWAKLPGEAEPNL